MSAPDTPQTLTSRQALIGSLCDDLNALGWEQPVKMWFLRGEPGDEYFEFVSAQVGDPEDQLLKIIGDGTSNEGVVGVAIAFEGWGYPANVEAALHTKQQLEAMWRMRPPSSHPERVELRQVVLTTRGGEVNALTYRHEGEGVRRWHSLPESSVGEPTDNRVIDGSRAFLGDNEALAARIRGASVEFAEGATLTPVEAMETLMKLTEVMRRYQEGGPGVTDADVMDREMFMAFPEVVRLKLVEMMPPDLKTHLRALLTDEEANKYGL